jgi:hypothetical protein
MMKKLNKDQFVNWLESYGKASKENDAKASSELFSLDAEY